MGAAREYFPEKIHWPDESPASKQTARERGTFDAIFARVFAARDARKERKKRRRRQAKRAEGKNCSMRDRKLASPTYNRQGRAGGVVRR